MGALYQTSTSFYNNMSYYVAREDTKFTQFFETFSSIKQLPKRFILIRLEEW